MLIISIIACTALGMLIHEFGHLLVARRCRVLCTELGLGLGPKLFSVNIRNVCFSLRAIPFGSFVRLEGLGASAPARQVCIHLGGIAFNLVLGFAAYGTLLGRINLLIAAGNLVPLYQHDGWKCGLVILRTLMRRKSQPAEWALTFSGGFVSLVIGWAIMRMFM
jgi:membrane-associated protease RseP (regulator of RpoE activity)